MAAKKNAEKTEKPIVALVKLSGATLPLDPPGIVLLNTEVEARKVWYAGFTTGTPRKPYSTPQRAALTALENAKRALVTYTGGDNFKLTCKLIGYSPQFAPRTRMLTG